MGKERKEIMKNGTPKKIVGALVKVVLAAVVLVYLGLHTINFFMYTFPPEQWYLSWLGFGLTGGGLIGYLVVFLWDADTQLKKTTALLMVVVCGVGEVLAAGFGMQIEAWAKNGWTMTEQDFNMMLLAIRALAFAHFIALTVYVAGDKVGEMFGDHDGDGVPNWRDPDYGKAEPVTIKASETENVRQLGATFTPEQIAALRNILGESPVGQGSVNGNGAVDPTKAAPK
jgi:hypothetical protein